MIKYLSLKKKIFVTVKQLKTITIKVLNKLNLQYKFQEQKMSKQVQGQQTFRYSNNSSSTTNKNNFSIKIQEIPFDTKFSSNILSSSTYSPNPLSSSQQKPKVNASFSYATSSISQSQSQQLQKQQQQSVYQQYIKTLQTEISSRERQRVELYRNLQQMRTDNYGLFHELAEQKKKISPLLKKIQDNQFVISKMNEKYKSYKQQKQVIVQELQLQKQRNINLSAVQHNIRQHLQRLQSQFNIKSSQYLAKINNLRQQNITLKTTIEELQMKMKSIQSNSQGFRRQIIQITRQKTRIIQSILVEKSQIEVDFKKQKQEIQRLTNLNKQKQHKISLLQKQLTENQHLYSKQKTSTDYHIKQLQFYISNLRKQLQFNKQNFNKDQSFWVNQNSKLRVNIVNLERQRGANLQKINQVQKQLQRIKSINYQLSLQNSVKKTQHEKQQVKYQQQLKTMKQHIQQLQIVIVQRTFSFESLTSKYNDLQLVYSNKNEQYVRLVQDKIKQITSLKLSNHQISISYQQTIQKSNQQKNQLHKYYKQQLQKQRKQQQTVSTKKITTIKQQHSNKQTQIKNHYQNVIVYNLNTQIYNFKLKIAQLNQQHQQQLQQIIKEKQYQSSMNIQSHHNRTQQVLKNIQDHMRVQLMEKNIVIKNITQQNSSIKQQNQSLSNQLINLKQEIKRNSQLFYRSKQEQSNRDKSEKQKLKLQFIGQKKQLQDRLNNIKKQYQKHLEQLNHQLHHQKQSFQGINQQKQNLIIRLKISQQNFIRIQNDLKHKIMILQHQNAQILSIMNKKQKDITQQYRQLKQYEEKEYQNTKKQYQNGINQLQRQIAENEKYFMNVSLSIQQVIEFINKLQQENQQILIKQEQQNVSQIISLNIINNNKFTTTINNKKNKTNNKNPIIRQTILQKSYYQNNLINLDKSQATQQFKLYCNSIKQFIRVKCQEYKQLQKKNQQQNLNQLNLHQTVMNLQQTLKQQKQQYQILQNKYNQRNIQFENLKYESQKSKQQEIHSINKLKQHIAMYKKQLTRYQSDIMQISTKVQDYQILSFKAQQKIQQLQEQLTKTQNNLQKTLKKHQSQLINNQFNHKKQIQTIKQQYQTHIHNLQKELQSKTNESQSECIYLKDKLKQIEKINQRKSQKYQQLQAHHALTIQRLKFEYQNKIQRYQNQITFLKNTQGGNTQILNRRVQLLQEDIRQRQQQVKILQENNTLLRKNIISSINEKQSLKEELKSQQSKSQSKSRSKQKSRRDSTSQQLKKKYLSRRNNLDRSQGNINMVVSTARSYSIEDKKERPQLLYTQNKRQMRQTPIPQIQSLAINSRISRNNNRGIQTQRPVSNFQRTPYVPLDLKKLKERNQRNNQQHNKQSTTRPVVYQDSVDSLVQNNDRQNCQSKQQLNDMNSPIKLFNSKKSSFQTNNSGKNRDNSTNYINL